MRCAGDHQKSSPCSPNAAPGSGLRPARCRPTSYARTWGGHNRAAFRGSPMKSAKLPAMKRNAAVVLVNVGASDEIDALTHA